MLRILQMLLGTSQDDQNRIQRDRELRERQRLFRERQSQLQEVNVQLYALTQIIQNSLQTREYWFLVNYLLPLYRQLLTQQNELETSLITLSRAIESRDSHVARTTQPRPSHVATRRAEPAQVGPLAKNDLDRLSPELAPEVIENLKQRKVKNWQSNNWQSIDEGQMYYLIKQPNPSNPSQPKLHFIGMDYARSLPPSHPLMPALLEAQENSRVIKGSEISQYAVEKFPQQRPTTMAIDQLADQDKFKKFEYYDVMEAGFTSIKQYEEDGTTEKKYYFVPKSPGVYSIFDETTVNGLMEGTNGKHPETRFNFTKNDLQPISYSKLIEIHRSAFPAEASARGEAIQTATTPARSEARPTTTTPSHASTSSPVSSPSSARTATATRSPASAIASGTAHVPFPAVDNGFDASVLTNHSLDKLSQSLALSVLGKEYVSIQSNQTYYVVGGFVVTERSTQELLNSPNHELVNATLKAMEKPIRGATLLAYVSEQQQAYDQYSSAMRLGRRH